MKKKFPRFTAALFVGVCAFSFLLSNCSGDKASSAITFVEPLKIHDTDPFKNNIIPSQVIEIDGAVDNTIEGKNGTVVVIPKGSFRKKDGSEVTGKIEIELAEALNPAEMITSNLTTSSDGKPLESGGMIYINARSNGEQLGVANDNPLYIYIPANDKKPGMQVYTGTRDKEGNMNWVNPQPLREFLSTVPLKDLDFLPDGFAEAVKSGLPFRNFKAATREVVDTLYFMNDIIFGQVAAEYSRLRSLQLSNITEPMYSEKKSFDFKTTRDTIVTDNQIAADSCPTIWESINCCSIDPKQIKTLRDSEYANTFIATKAFEKRIKTLHRICGRKLLRIYIDNLDKDLWQIDSMVADRLKGEPDKESVFRKYASEKLTNVKDADKTAALLKGYFDKKLAENKKEEDRLKAQAIKEANARSEKLEGTIRVYKAVLNERETYRMEGYGFVRTELGWINVDIGTGQKTWSQQILTCNVRNGNDFERVYCYLYIPDKKSLHKFYQQSKTVFNTGGLKLQYIPLPQYDVVVIAVVGYNGSRMYSGFANWSSRGSNDIVLDLNETDMATFTSLINAKMQSGDQNNNIFVDLAFQDTFYQAEQRRKTLDVEMDFMGKLYRIINACCFKCNEGSQVAGAELLFNAKCASCHLPTNEKSTGPGLAGISSRIPGGDWKYNFIRNSSAVIASGDAYANKIYKEHAGSKMPPQAITNEEIDAIIAWLDCQPLPAVAPSEK